jgi:conjugal transfer mating pair stabilization protein TraG
MLRADTQARNTYTSISQQAMTWVPLLNIVLTVVFYAMFPVIFPLFLMPQTGPAALKGYITGFFYLAAWGPLYVVLHMFVMGRTISAMQAASPGGITMASMSGIDAVNADTATIAGFLMMSVPFLAAGLARGAMAVASNATSMLAPAQSAAEAAANERTSGNYAYGNLSYQNLTGNTVQRDQWREAPSFEGGAAMSAFRTNEGATIRNYADGAGGATVYDTSAARSSMGFSIQEGKAIHAMAKASEDRTRNESLSLSYQASQLESSGTRTFHGHTTSDTTSSGADSRSTAENSVSQSHARTNQNANSRSSTNSSNWGEQTSKGERASVGTDASMGVAGTLSASANAGGGAGGAGGGTGPVSGNLGVGASNNNRVDWKGSEGEFGERSRSSGKSRSDSTGSRSESSESATSGSSESTGSSAARYNSNSKSSSNNAGSETSDDHRQQLLRQADQKMAESRSWHRIAERLESNDFRMSEDLMPVLQSRYEELRQSGEMGVNLPAFYKVNLTDTERGVRSIALSRIMTNLSADQLDSFASDHSLPGGDLPAIDPGSISMPAIPRGNSGASAPSGGPDDSPGRFPVPEIQAGTVDGRALARDTGVSIKTGANVRELDGEMAPVMGAVANASARLGLPSPTVTSGNDSTQHVDGSQHYENRAIDFRGRDITISQGRALAREVQADLGAGYRANFEVFADEPSRNHLHVQLVGKR